MKYPIVSWREQMEPSAKLEQLTCLRRCFGRQVWANLACLCVSARRQEDIGYGG